MRRQSTQRVLKEVRKTCRTNGIDVVLIPSHGKGSHFGLLFSYRKTDEEFRIVISGKNEISAGVQRRALNYLRDLAKHVPWAEIVRRAFEAIFKK